MCPHRKTPTEFIHCLGHPQLVLSRTAPVEHEFNPPWSEAGSPLGPIVHHKHLECFVAVFQKYGCVYGVKVGRCYLLLVVDVINWMLSLSLNHAKAIWICVENALWFYIACMPINSKVEVTLRDSCEIYIKLDGLASIQCLSQFDLDNTHLAMWIYVSNYKLLGHVIVWRRWICGCYLLYFMRVHFGVTVNCFEGINSTIDGILVSIYKWSVSSEIKLESSINFLLVTIAKFDHCFIGRDDHQLAKFIWEKLAIVFLF